MTLSLTALSAFTDNYIWALYDQKQAVIVDPGDAKVVLSFLKEKKLELHAIFITHHHQDHVLGLSALKAHYPHAIVYGPAENIPNIDVIIDKDSNFHSNLLGEVSVFTTPGHTLGHIAFFVAAHNCIFTGDTLFSGGCGRLFEGSAAQLFNSLKKITQLPSNTLICCAHEYTLSNLLFAEWLEPDNHLIQDRLQFIQALRSNQLSSLPVLLKTELSYNPFLRTNSHALLTRLRTLTGQNYLNELDVFIAIRKLKDSYKP
jgi:hydroxyacylglutathione hydrolase